MKRTPIPIAAAALAAMLAGCVSPPERAQPVNPARILLAPGEEILLPPPEACAPDRDRGPVCARETSPLPGRAPGADRQPHRSLRLPPQPQELDTLWSEHRRLLERLQTPVEMPVEPSAR